MKFNGPLKSVRVVFNRRRSGKPDCLSVSITLLLYSSGFALIMISLNICDSVSVFGFSYKKSNQTHYYERGAQGLPTRSHNVEDEYRVLSKLHDDGVINWVQ